MLAFNVNFLYIILFHLLISRLLNLANKIMILKNSVQRVSDLISHAEVFDKSLNIDMLIVKRR